MLKKIIDYTDFNGQEHHEEFYFNLSTSELVEMAASKDGGLGEHLQTIVKSGDAALIFSEFKKLILKAYGERTPDGRFVKNDQVSAKFEQTGAFDALLMSFFVDANSAAEFINGLIPSNLGEKLNTNKTQSVEVEPLFVRENRQPTKPELMALSPEQMRELFTQRFTK